MKLSGNIIVLSADSYKFTEETTGELISGCKIFYVDDLQGYSKDKHKGVSIAKATMDENVFDSLPNLPAHCIADYVMTVNAKGQSLLKISEITYVEPLNKPSK